MSSYSKAELRGFLKMIAQLIKELFEEEAPRMKTSVRKGTKPYLFAIAGKGMMFLTEEYLRTLSETAKDGLVFDMAKRRIHLMEDLCDLDGLGFKYDWI